MMIWLFGYQNVVDLKDEAPPIEWMLNQNVMELDINVINAGNEAWQALMCVSVQILMAVLLFVIPNPRKPKEKLMTWSQCNDIHWNVILLVGGGLLLVSSQILNGSCVYIYMSMYVYVCVCVCVHMEN